MRPKAPVSCLTPASTQSLSICIRACSTFSVAAGFLSGKAAGVLVHEDNYSMVVARVNIVTVSFILMSPILKLLRLTHWISGAIEHGA